MGLLNKINRLRFKLDYIDSLKYECINPSVGKLLYCYFDIEVNKAGYPSNQPDQKEGILLKEHLSICKRCQADKLVLEKIRGM